MGTNLSEGQLENDIRELAEKGVLCKVDLAKGEIICDSKHCMRNEKNPKIHATTKETLTIPKADFNKKTVEEYFGV